MALLLTLVLLKTIHLIMPITNVFVIEVFVVMALLLVTLCFRTSLLVAALILVLCLGFIFNPITLLLFLSFFHNITPWGFLALQKRSHRAWLLFVLNPCIVFLLAFKLAIDPSIFLPAQSLTFLSHYLLLPQLSAINFAFFAAAVYLQLIHYYCVLRVLPKFSCTPIRTNKYQLVTFAITGIAFMLFFKLGKPIYSIIALFHAYLEIPVLLYLLAPQGNTAGFKSIRITN